MPKNVGTRRIQFLISRLSGLEEDDPIVSGMTAEGLEIFVSDYEGQEFDLSCEGDYVGGGLDDGDVRLLTSGLERNFVVQSLLLWGNNDITDSSAIYLQKLLSSNMTLTEINLDLTSISDTAKREIQRSLLDRRISRLSIRNPFDELRICDLSRAGLSDAGMARVDSILKRNPLITSLALWGNPDLTDQGAKHLKTVLQSNTNVEQLTLDMTSLKQTVKDSLLEIVRKNGFQKYLRQVEDNDPWCTTLPFSNAGITGKDMKHLCTALNTNTSVTKIVLTKNPQLTTKDMEQLFSVLPKTRVVNVEADWSNFDAKAVAGFKKSILHSVKSSLLQQSPSSTSVNMSDLGLSNEDVLSLLSAVQSNSKLQHLNLSRNPLVSDDVAISLQHVIQIHPVLSKISLSGTSCTRRTVARLSDDLKNHRVAQLVLELGTNTINSASLRGLDLKDADLEPIALALTNCSTLRSLDLSGNKGLTDHGLQTIYSAIGKENPPLVKVCLDNTGTTEYQRIQLRGQLKRRALTFAKRLASGRMGATIDLSGISLRDSELVTVLAFFDSSHSVSQLNLSFNPALTDVSGEALLRIVETNTGLVQIKLQGTGIGAVMCSKVLDLVRSRALQASVQALSSFWHPPLLNSMQFVRWTEGQDLDDEHFRILYDAMLRSTEVWGMDLSNNQRLTDASGRMIVDALRSNTVWTYLDLERTGLGPSLRTEISIALRDNALNFAKKLLDGQMFQDLSVLKAKNIRDNDLIALCPWICRNCSVQTIDLSSNPQLTDDIVPVLKNTLCMDESRSAVRSICLDDTSVSMSGKMIIENACKYANSRHNAIKALKMDNSKDSLCGEVSKDLLSSNTSHIMVDDLNAELNAISDEIEHGISDLSLTAKSLRFQSAPCYSTTSDLQKRMNETARALESVFGEEGMCPTVQDVYGASTAQTNCIVQRSSAPQSSLKTSIVSIGVRLKLHDRGPGSSASNLKSDLCRLLCVPEDSIELASPWPSLVGADDEDNIYDFNLFAENLDKCKVLSARLFALSEDSKGELCQRHNQGKEILCVPWATGHGRFIHLDQSADTSLAEANKSNLSFESLSLDSLSLSVCKEIASILYPRGNYNVTIVNLLKQSLARLSSIFIDSTSGSLYPIDHDALLSLSSELKKVCEEYVLDSAMKRSWDTHVSESVLKIKQLFYELQDLWQNVANGVHREKHHNFASSHDLLRGYNQACEDVTLQIKNVFESNMKAQQEAGKLLLNEKDSLLKFKHLALEELQSQFKSIQTEIDDLRQDQSNDLAIIMARLESYFDSARRVVTLRHQAHAVSQTERSMQAKSDQILAEIDKKLHNVDFSHGFLNHSPLHLIEKSVSKIAKAYEEHLEVYSEKIWREEQVIAESIYQKSILGTFLVIEMIANELQKSIALDKKEIEDLHGKPFEYAYMGKASKIKEAIDAWSSGSTQSESLGSCSIDKQISFAGEIDQLRSDLKAEAELMWEAIKSLNAAEVICPGSEFELVVFTAPPQYQMSHGSRSWFVLPKIRSITTTFQEMQMYEGLETKDLSSVMLDHIFEQGVSALVQNCVSSKRFQLDMIQALREAKQTNKLVELSCLQVSKAEREVTGLQKTMQSRMDAAKDSEALVIKNRMQVRKKQDMLIDALKELQEAKKALQNENQRLKDTTLELKKAQEAVIQIQKKVKLMTVERDKAQKHLSILEDRCTTLTDECSTLQAELNMSSDEKSRQLAIANKSVKQANDHAFKSKLFRDGNLALKWEAAKKQNVLDAYRKVAHTFSIPPNMHDHGLSDTKSHWCIDQFSLVFCHNIWLETKEDIFQHKMSDKQKSAMLEAIRNSVVLLLSLCPTAGERAEQRLYNRIHVMATTDTAQDGLGGCDIHIRFLEDHLEPCEMYITFLRQSLFPTNVDILPARLFLGRGRYSCVSRLKSSEYLATCSRGSVRAAQLGQSHVVVKKRFFCKSDALTAKRRIEVIQKELASRFGTIATIRHPNILQYIGFFVEDSHAQPPSVSLVQEYCESNLSILLAQHHGHDPDIDLDNKEVAQLFKELDVRGDGKISQSLFVKRVKEKPSIAAKLGISSTALSASGDLKFVWNYDDDDPIRPLAQRHKFAYIDHNGDRTVDLRKLRAYFGAREFGDGWIPWSMRIEIALSVTRGMQCLSSHGIVHGRLRSVNIAVGTGSSGPEHTAGGTWNLGRVSIMDFGEEYIGDACGGLRLGPFEDSTGDDCAWRAPEFASARIKCASTEGDVWGLGVIMWELWTGRQPNFDRLQEDVAKISALYTEHSAAGKDVPNLQIPVLQPPPGSYVLVMSQCLSVSPAARPSFEQVESHILSNRGSWPPEYLPG